MEITNPGCLMLSFIFIFFLTFHSLSQHRYEIDRNLTQTVIPVGKHLVFKRPCSQLKGDSNIIEQHPRSYLDHLNNLKQN